MLDGQGFFHGAPAVNGGREEHILLSGVAPITLGPAFDTVQEGFLESSLGFRGVSEVCALIKEREERAV